MLDPRLPDEKSALTVVPARIEVVLSDEERNPLTLVSTPVEDLAEMRALSSNNFSLKTSVENAQAHIAWYYEREMFELKRRASTFDDSPTFHNRLANLAGAAGDKVAEFDHTSRADALDPRAFFKHRLSSNLLDRGLEQAAETLLKDESLAKDSHTHLRFAFFHMRRMDVESACASVARAVEIDPIDFGARLFEGALRLVQGKYEKAISSFRIAEEAKPTSSVLFCNMALAYVQLGKFEKAMATLRRSMALGPLNRNALLLYSDIASKCGRDYEVLPSLRLFVQFEQRDPAIWGRLSRSLLATDQFAETISALKRQGSLNTDDATVWNNLGVAYHRIGDSKRAAESYKRAIELDEKAQSRTFFLAARNFVLLLNEASKSKEVVSFVSLFKNAVGIRKELTEREHAELIMLRIHSLFRTDRASEAVKDSEAILADASASGLMKVWALIGLLSWYPFNGKTDRAVELASGFAHLSKELAGSNDDLRFQFLNNLAFVFADSGDLSKATEIMKTLSARIHRDCYPTATLGLIHLRKGDTERGKALYEEAIRLALPAYDKARIKQKYLIEMARIEALSGEQRKAVRSFERAASVKGGEDSLVRIARQALKLLN